MRRHRRHGRALLELPHHGAVLADARVAADRSQRDDATAWRRSPSSAPASPGSRPASRSRTASSPRCSPSTGTTPTASASGTSRRARSATWPRTRGAGRSDAASSASTASSAASRTRGIPTSSTTTTRSTRRRRPRRATTSPRTSPTRRSQFIRDAKVVDPDKPFFMYLAPECGHAPHHVFEEWADKYKGKFDEGYEAIRAGDPGAPEGARPAARGHRAVADQPARRAGTHRPRRPAVAAARHRATVGLAERRRAAAVRRGWPRCSPATSPTPTTRSAGSSTTSRQPGELDNTIIVVISDNGASGEGGPNGSFNEWRFFNGMPDTTETDAAAHRRARHRRRRTTTTTPAGRGRSTRRSRTGSGGPATRAASPTCASCRGRRRSRRRRTSRHQYVHAVDVVPTIYELLGIEPPEVLKGYTQSPIEGESFAASAHRPDGAGEGDAVLRDARPALDLPRGLAGLHGAPADLGLGQLRPRRVGALRPRARPRAVEEPRRAGARAARGAEEPVVLLRGHLQRAAARRPHRARADRSPSGRTARPTATSTSTTRTAPTCPSSPVCSINGRSYTHRGRRRRRVGRRRGRAVRARRRRRRSQPLRQGQEAALHVQLGRHAPAGRRRRPRASRPGTHVFTADFAAEGPERGSGDAGLRRHADALRRRGEGRRGRDRHPAGLFCLGRRRHLRRSRQRVAGHARLRRGRSSSPAAPSTRSSSTSRASASSTTRPRCSAGSPRTDPSRRCGQRRGRPITEARV